MSNWHSLIKLIDTAVGAVAPAIVCQVEQGSEVQFVYAAGTLNPDAAATNGMAPLATIKSSFDYASLTKLFTTTACLCLVDQGHLSLDTPLVEIFPEFGEIKLLGGAEDPITKQPIPADPRWAELSGLHWQDATKVTIHSLLTHTSGLPAWRSVYRSCGRVPHQAAVMQKAEQSQRAHAGMSALLAYPLIYPPMQGYAYSDVGFMLLGQAVAHLYANGNLNKAITELVLKPLELSAAFLPDEARRKEIAATEQCTWRGRRLLGEVHDENAAGIGGVAAHAGLFGAAADLCRLGSLYLKNGDLPSGKRLLSCRLTHEATSEQHCSDGIRRGLGWMLPSQPKPSCSHMFSPHSFGHTGYTGTSLWCDPERDLTVALLTNRVYYGRNPQQIASFRPALHAEIATIVDQT